MPKTYNEVREEFLGFKSRFPDDPTPLGEYAKQVDQVDGTPGERSSAYNDNALKQINAFIDRGFQATGLPAASSAVLGGLAGGVDTMFGTNTQPTVERVAEELPRGIAESLATIPLAAVPGGQVAAAGVVANRINQIRKFLKPVGYASTGLAGYGATDSPLGAVISMGTMKAGNKLLLPEANAGLDVGLRAEKGVESWLTKGLPEIDAVAGKSLAAEVPKLSPLNEVARTVPVLANVGTQAGVATGLNEASRQASMSVGPNAVGLTDPSRNPLSMENVAAQAVGGLGFVPQAAVALAKRPAFQSKQAKQWFDWHENRQRALEESGIFGLSKKDVSEAVLNEKAHENMKGTMINSFIDYYQHLASKGDPMAEKYKGKLLEWFGDDGWVKEDVDNVLGETPKATRGNVNPQEGGMAISALAESVKQDSTRPITTIDEFAKFKLDLGVLIDQINESGSHPNARSSVLVEQLQKKKLLPEITDKWYQDEMGKELERGMDPNTALDVVKQRAANMVLDQVPAALEARAKMPVEEGTDWKPAQKAEAKQADVAQLNERFVEALRVLPPEVRPDLVKRSVEFLNENPVISKVGNTKGREVGRYASWRLAVIKAAESFDPETGTVMMYKGTKVDPTTGKRTPQFSRVPISEMVATDEGGNYLFKPRWSPVSTQEGGKKVGKFKGKTILEGNIEGMVEPDNIVSDTMADEADYNRALAEEGAWKGSLEDQMSTVKGGEVGGPAVPGKVVETGETSPEFLTVPEGEAGQKWGKRVEVLKSNLSRLSDEELNRITDGFFVRKSPEGKPYADPHARNRRPQMRSAILAALEQFSGEKGGELGPDAKAFLALRREGKSATAGRTERQQLLIELKDFFKQQTPVEGAPEGLKNHEARFGQVVQALLDEKKVGGVEGVRDLLKTRANVDPTTGEAVVPTKGAEFTEGSVAQDFVPRVRQMLTQKIYQAMGEAGHSGTYRALFTEMVVALAMQTQGIETRFYELANAGTAAGLAQAKEGVGRVGVVLKNVMDDKDVHSLLGTLAHEIHHIQQMAMEGLLPQRDAFSQYQAKAMQNMENLATMMTAQERDGMLTMLQETFQPEGFRSIGTVKETGRLYGSESPKEFTAQVAGILAGSLLNPKMRGEMSPYAILSWMPQEVKEYSQGFFRAIEDVFDGVQKAVADPEVRKVMGGQPLDAVGQKAKTFQADTIATILASAREGSRLRDADINAQAMMRQVLTLSPKAGDQPPIERFENAVWSASKRTIDEAYKGTGMEPPTRMSVTAEDAVKTARDVVYREVKDPTTRPGLWARWFYPFTQLMNSMERAGVPLARPLGMLSTDIAGNIKRTQSLFMSPWTVKNPDGTVKLDHQNALIDRLGKEKVGPWRDAVNAVSRWQQEQGATVSMFVKDEGTGVVSVNPQAPGIQAQWDKIRSRLSPEDQSLVMAASVAMDEQGQLMAARTVATLQKSMENNVAATLIKAYKMPYDKAQEMATMLVPAYLQLFSKSPADKQAATGIIGKFVSPGPVREMLDGLMVGEGGLVPKFIETKDRLLSRTAYRTETLPGDFILRFRKPDAAENDFSYLSATTEKQANHLAKKLQDEGNVIVGEIARKSEIRDYAEFDDPDAILRSFVDVEQSKWRQLVDQIRKSHGDEVAEELLAYSPGVESERFLATKGMGKTLVERQSKVDRSRFDYIDAAMSHAQRLATTLEYRRARQEKNLILADPRAKLYPSLKPLVNNHFDELMSPSTRFGQEMRTFAGAYMMGGSLASAVINATQSLTTLLPVLVQGMGKTGGVVGAYRLLGKNIADMVKISTDTKWQQIASAAELKDPSTWTKEEAKYALYKRNVEEGGIDHGIILDDIFSGTDTRAMLTSKFGRGDYGPVTKGELARNGLYLAAQLSLQPFGWIEKQNNKVALLSGIEQGYDKGLRGESLYDYARQVKSLATFGGGKSNAPGLVGRLSNQYTRSAVGMANVLQQYGYGVVALYAQQVKDALGKSPALSPLERRQAAKAFLTMFSTQVALGGALGLPFVGAALTLIEQLTGTPANQLVREGLAGLSDDETVAPVIAETALNGLGNQMFGFDVSSRVGVSSMLGTSAYKGFNLADMVGPTGSIVKNMADALNYFGQNRPEKAVTSLVPNAVRTGVELYNTKKQFGDYGVRDQTGSLLYQMSPNEAALYAIGFRPTEVSRKRQMQRLVTTANTLATQKQGSQFDRAATDLLQGNTQTAMDAVKEYTMRDPLIDPQEMYRSIVDRAVDASFPKDVLAGGPRAAEGARTAIAGTFQPEVNPRQSEVDRELMAMQLGASLGLRPNQRKLQKAAMVDALVGQSRMPRSEALRLMEFLH